MTENMRGLWQVAVRETNVYYLEVTADSAGLARQLAEERLSAAAEFTDVVGPCRSSDVAVDDAEWVGPAHDFRQDREPRPPFIPGGWYCTGCSWKQASGYSAADAHAAHELHHGGNR